jgi:Protein of unknown function (DUF2950)
MRRVSPCFPQSAVRRSVQAGLGGFALVSYPTEYRNSGVITFLVNHQGSVYEKDRAFARRVAQLGADCPGLARRLSSPALERVRERAQLMKAE